MKTLKDINTSTKEGQLLFAAIIKMTGESHAELKPEETLHQVEELADKMSFGLTGWEQAMAEDLKDEVILMEETFIGGPLLPHVIDIITELTRAEKLHPEWPTDLVYQSSILAEEAGEALKEANNIVIDGKPNYENHFKEEVIQTAAMCLRILKNL